MTSDLDKGAPSTGDRKRSMAYHRDFWPSIAGYTVALIAALLWGHLDGDSPARFVWAVLPALPGLLMVRAVLRHIKRIDDYRRLLLLQGLAVGFAIAMIAALTAGLLAVAGLPMRGAGWVIYAAGMTGWIVASGVTRKR